LFGKKSFGTRLRKIRKQNKYTQEQVAADIGCLRSTLSNIERGEKDPSLDMLLSLANYFEVSIDYLLGATDFPYPLSEKVLNIINQSRDPEELMDTIKKIVQSEKSGQAADQPGKSKIDSLTEGLDEESVAELKKYAEYLKIRQTLDGGTDESSAGLDGNAGNNK